MLNHNKANTSSNKIKYLLNNKPAVIIVILLSIIGVYFMSGSHAAAPYAAVSASSGVLTGSAVNYSDSNTSTGMATRFGTSDSSGFITTSGTNFMLAGKIFQYIGYDFYGAAETCYNGTTTIDELKQYFSSLPPNGVTRIWAFQSGGSTGITNVVNVAKSYHQHLILTLGDDDVSCGDTDYAKGTPPYINEKGKTLAFYQYGWKGNYLSWVNTVVPMFKNEPTVMMWEVANEPGNVGDHPSETDMKAYLEGTSDAIRAQDTNHLISVGTNYPGAIGSGTNTDFENALSVPNIDAISVHDYSYDEEHGAIISSNFAVAKQASQQLNKPFYIGEAGVMSGATCATVHYTTLSLADRVTFLKSKADAYLSGGAGGIGFWEYEPSQASWIQNCAYEIYPTDLLIPMVQNYVIP